MTRTFAGTGQPWANYITMSCPEAWVQTPGMSRKSFLACLDADRMAFDISLVLTYQTAKSGCRCKVAHQLPPMRYRTCSTRTLTSTTCCLSSDHGGLSAAYGIAREPAYSMTWKQPPATIVAPKGTSYPCRTGTETRIEILFPHWCMAQNCVFMPRLAGSRPDESEAYLPCL